MPAGDLVLAGVVLALVGGVNLAYLLRLASKGRARDARLDGHGGSAVLSKGMMEVAYWSFRPLVNALAGARVSPAAVTWASLVLGLGAGCAVAGGRFGLAGTLAGLSAIADALDGALARRLGTASDAGEVLDAAIDRYAELAVLGGLVVAFRANLALVLLGLAALTGAFMISYSTAKAEAMGVPPPRGLMRRGERAAYVFLGLILTPFSEHVVGPQGTSWARHAPIVLVLALIAVLANASAANRLAKVARALTARARAPKAAPPAPGRTSPAATDDEANLSNVAGRQADQSRSLDSGPGVRISGAGGLAGGRRR